MLLAEIIFFVLAVLAFVLGANGVAGLSMEIGRILLFVFVVLAVISLVISFTQGKKPRLPL